MRNTGDKTSAIVCKTSHAIGSHKICEAQAGGKQKSMKHKFVRTMMTKKKPNDYISINMLNI